LHTNYKLSAEGENVLLLTPEQEIINLVEYPATTIERSYARIPDGTGDFTWASPTFNESNDYFFDFKYLLVLSLVQGK
jgi:hypothetical protein